MVSELVPEFDLNSLDFARPIADRDAIRGVNPHRHEFELLSGVVHLDPVEEIIIGYKDTTPDEFWARGHFPEYAIMPGVLMCEAAAQLGNYFTLTQKVVEADRLIGLGGIETTRFRGTVRPGDRLILVGKGIRVSARMTKFAFQGFVKNDQKYQLVFESVIIGVPIGKWEEIRRA